jgi:hypothetical protein
MFDFDKADEDTRMGMKELRYDLVLKENPRDVKVQSSCVCLPARRLS